MQWQPGQGIGEYFFTLKRKATYAKLWLKHVASLLAAQLPRDIQTRIKAEITDIDDGLEHEHAHKLIRTVKNELVEEGYGLNKGNRDFEGLAKVAVIHAGVTADEINSEPSKSVAHTRGAFSNHRARQEFKSRQSDGCFIYGRSHPWRFCPDKRCPACGQKGHVVKTAHPSVRKETHGR